MTRQTLVVAKITAMSGQGERASGRVSGGWVEVATEGWGVWGEVGGGVAYRDRCANGHGAAPLTSFLTLS